MPQEYSIGCSAELKLTKTTIKLNNLKNMETILIEDLKDFEKFIDEAKLNIRYEMPINSRYKWIKFEKGNEYYSKDIYYCWAMEYNYKVSRCTGYIYPCGGANKVAHFKTEKGAKRNFKKSYLEYFKDLFNN